jgi:hypothetical protein
MSCSYVLVSNVLRIRGLSTYVWLVHDTEGDLGLAAVLLCQLLPYIRQLRINWSTLANNLVVPSSVVVKVENTQRCTRLQASLHEAIVLGEVVRIKCSTKLVVEQELPAYWETERVETVVLNEMVHLSKRSAATDDVVGLVRARQGAFAVDCASKVEPGDVHTCVLNLCGACRDLSWCSSHQGRASNCGEDCCLHGDELR